MLAPTVRARIVLSVWEGETVANVHAEGANDFSRLHYPAPLFCMCAHANAKEVF
jgi:hypothetical protein